MLVLSEAKASLELSTIWYWWWHARGMLASKRVRVATREWWRAGWQCNGGAVSATATATRAARCTKPPPAQAS